MTQEKNTITIAVTPAQKQLLELCNHANASEIYLALKCVLELGTYFTDPQLVHLPSSYQCQQLIDAVQGITVEKFSNNANTVINEQ